MKSILPALLSMLGLSRDVPEPVQAPESAPVVDTGDPAGLAYLPRGSFPRRRAYGLPAGDWSTPAGYLRPVSAAIESTRRMIRGDRESRRARAWAATCATRGYA